MHCTPEYSVRLCHSLSESNYVNYIITTDRNSSHAADREFFCQGKIQCGASYGGKAKVNNGRISDKVIINQIIHIVLDTSKHDYVILFIL